MLPSWNSKNAIIQATVVWKAATAKACHPLPISRLTAPIAATQGVYSRVKTKKEAAARGVNRPESACGRVAMLVPVRTASVLTTASLAVKPVISEVETRQSLKPRGMPDMQKLVNSLVAG